MMNTNHEVDSQVTEAPGCSGGAEDIAAPHDSYEKPQIVSWSPEDLEKAGTNLSACVSFGM